jgi:uncharacterized membrane protein
MGSILTNLRTTIHISLALAVIFLVGYAFAYDSIGFGAAFWMAAARWSHVVAGIMWIGLLWYFNFVQIPTMPSIPDEMKPAIGKHIAPAALFWFRWGAAFTVLTGLIVAHLRGYMVEVLSLGALAETYSPQYSFIGIGMWLAIIMAINLAQPEDCAGYCRGRSGCEAEGGPHRNAVFADQYAAVIAHAGGDGRGPDIVWLITKSHAPG